MPEPSRTPRPLLLAVAGLTLLGFLLRLSQFDQSLLGDELSTYWIIDGNSFGEVLSSVRSDDEITPPLYFALGWLSLQIGPDPEWVRLPSLLFGTATIPLVYVLGARTVGRTGGVLAAAVFTLSPFMIYYAGEARSYCVMLALLTLSTIALLCALERREARWWVLYAACSCLAMLSHYTCVFPLAAQFLWALWAHREAWRPLLLANLGAVVAFAPWLPGFIADNNSPTTEILSALSPFEFGAVRFALENWAAGYPYVRLDTVPGHAAGILIAAGVVLAAGALLVRFARRPRRLPLRVELGRIPDRVVLVVALALAAPVGEAIFSAIGTNIIGARNLNASWPGLAVAIGGLLAAAGPTLAIACAALTIGGFGLAALKTLDDDLARPDYAAAAALIEREADPGDVVIDAASFTPVPLTGLEVYLDPDLRVFNPGLPSGEEPFLPLTPVPDEQKVIEHAYDAAGGRRVFLLGFLETGDLPDATTDRLEGAAEFRQQVAADALRSRPPGYEVVDRQAFRGLDPIGVYVLEDSGGG